MLILKILLAIVSILLIFAILTQSKGVGLGTTFGGSNFQSSRRGAEKALFGVTVALAALFIILSVLNLIF